VAVKEDDTVVDAEFDRESVMEADSLSDADMLSDGERLPVDVGLSDELGVCDGDGRHMQHAFAVVRQLSSFSAPVAK
jgi:hypothetical protein